MPFLIAAFRIVSPFSAEMIFPFIVIVIFSSLIAPLYNTDPSEPAYLSAVVAFNAKCFIY